MKKFLASIALSSLTLVVGCSDEVTDPIVNTITCNDVCRRYADCFDASYDVDGCTNRCENDATADEQQEQRLESCDTCIEDRSCASAVFSCSTECVGIVP